MLMSWEKVKLGDLYEVHNGLSKGGKFFGSGYPFLSFSTVFNNWFIPQNIKDLVQSTDKEQESYSIKKGDVFITRTSETADELGMSCVALKDYPQATYNGFCKRLRPIKSSYEVNPRYIGYYLRTSDFRGKFLGLSGTMTTRASLKNEDLLAMEILLPPLKEQKRIADILSAYDNLIENNQKQIKLLEEAAQRLYKQWFIDLRYPGHETTPIVDGLPEGWSITKIQDVCDNIGAGGTPSRSQKAFWQDGNIDWFKTQELCDCWLFESSEKISEEGLKRSAAKMFPASSILMAIYASPTLGRLGILTKEACSNQAALCLQADESKVSNYWLYLKLFELRNRFNSIARGAGQQNISGIIVKETEITLPAYSVMENFTEMVKPFFEKQRTLQLQNISLTQTRDRLLPKLMNGGVI